MATTARRYGEPVEVRLGMVPSPAGTAEGPAQFLWRGRLYLVRDLVAHWVETGAWWCHVEDPPADGDAPTGPTGPGDPAGLGDDEQEVWRVEAGAGRWAVPGVFDLSRDTSTGRWSVVRAHD